MMWSFSRFRILFLALLLGSFFRPVLNCQTLAGSGLNSIISLPGPMRDFYMIDFGVGFYGDNQFFIRDKVALKYDLNYSFLFGEGALRAEHFGLGFGTQLFFKEEGHIFRPFVGTSVGLDMAFARFYFGVGTQGGLMIEIGDSFLLELSARYRMAIGSQNLFFLEPRIGIVVNFDYF
jgi:hypothetical protein